MPLTLALNKQKTTATTTTNRPHESAYSFIYIYSQYSDKIKNKTYEFILNELAQMRANICEFRGTEL